MKLHPLLLAAGQTLRINTRINTRINVNSNRSLLLQSAGTVFLGDSTVLGDGATLATWSRAAPCTWAWTAA